MASQINASLGAVRHTVIVSPSSRIVEELRAEFDSTGRWHSTDIDPSRLTVSNGAEAVLIDDPAVVVLDGDLREEDEVLWAQLLTATPLQIFRRLRSNVDLPVSLEWFREIKKHLDTKGPSETLVFFLLTRSTSFLTQELLNQGINWIWSMDTNPLAELPEVAERIVRLRGLLESEGRISESEIHERLFVVENASAEVARLRAILEDDFDLYFVGGRMAPKERVITVDQATESFVREHAEQPFAAAIVDLALSRASEAEAEKWFLDNESARRAVVKIYESGPEWLREILGGLRVIESIIATTPEVPVFAVSNYLKEPETQNLVSILGPKHQRRVRWLMKRPEVYAELHELLITAIESARGGGT